MGLDLSNWDLGGNLDFGIGGTIDAGLPDYSVGAAPPIAALENLPLSNGIDFSGILSGIEKTAQTGIDLFSKVYSFQDKIEEAKFNRAMRQTRTQIAQAQAAGSLDVQRLQVDAGTQIAKLQAQRAVADAQAQMGSSSLAGYTSRAGGIGQYLPIIALVGGVVYLMKRKGSK